MKANDCAICYAPYIVIDEDNREIGYCPAPKKITYSMIKRDDKMGFSTMVYDIEKIGRKFYMPDMRRRQDWAMKVDMMRRSHQVAYGLKRPVAYYRRRAGSVSSNKLRLLKYNAQVYHEVLGYSWLKAYAYLLFCFLPTYFVKVMHRRAASRRWREGVNSNNSQLVH